MPCSGADSEGAWRRAKSAWGVCFVKASASTGRDGARTQEEAFGNPLIACGLANADFVKFAESFDTSGSRAHGRDELRRALREASAQREPSVIEVPVGAMPQPVGIHPHAAGSRAMMHLS